VPHVTPGPGSPALDAHLGRQRLPDDQQARSQDEHTGPGEKQEDSAPVGESGELAAEEGTHDSGQSGQHRQPRLVADQAATGVQVPVGGVGDHDPYATRKPLHEGLDRAAGGAQGRGSHVGGYAHEQRSATTETVRQRTRDQLPQQPRPRSSTSSTPERQT
jgi:hypothetical protein